MFKRKKIKNSYKSKFQRGNYFTEVQFQNVNRNFSYPCPWFFFHWLRNSYNFFIPPSVPIIAFSSWSFAFFPIFSLPSPTMIVWDKFLGISFKSPFSRGHSLAFAFVDRLKRIYATFFLRPMLFFFLRWHNFCLFVCSITINLLDPPFSDDPPTRPSQLSWKIDPGFWTLHSTSTFRLSTLR